MLVFRKTDKECLACNANTGSEGSEFTLRIKAVTGVIPLTKAHLYTLFTPKLCILVPPLYILVPKWYIFATF